MNFVNPLRGIVLDNGFYIDIYALTGKKKEC